MPKTIYTPRDELICGKIDRAMDLLLQIEKGGTGYVDMVQTLADIRNDAERMEAALVRRKDEVEALKKQINP